MIDRTAIYPTFVWTSGRAQSPCAGIPLQAYGSLLCEVLLYELSFLRKQVQLINVQPAVNRQPGYRWENS